MDFTAPAVIVFDMMFVSFAVVFFGLVVVATTGGTALLNDESFGGTDAYTEADETTKNKKRKKIFVYKMKLCFIKINLTRVLYNNTHSSTMYCTHLLHITIKVTEKKY